MVSTYSNSKKRININLTHKYKLINSEKKAIEIMFPAYNQHDRHRGRDDRNYRHSYDYQDRPHPYNDYHRSRNSQQNSQHFNEPPADLPEFATNLESMRRSYEAQQREEREREVRRQIEERVRREQEKSRHGLKQVTLDDYEDDEDDDPDIVTMVQ